MYKVTITKIETGVPYKKNEWQRLRDEVSDKHPDQYGYVVEEGTKTVTTELLEQTVEELDVKAVIGAINKL